MAMYVSIHATTHPVEKAGFLNLECDGFSVERRRLSAREERWIHHGPDMTIELIDVPQSELEPGSAVVAELPMQASEAPEGLVELRFRCA